MVGYAEKRAIEERLKESGEGFIFMEQFIYDDSKRPVILILGTIFFYELSGDDMEEPYELGNGRSYLCLDSAEEHTTSRDIFVVHQCGLPDLIYRGNQNLVAEAVVVVNSMIRDTWQRVCESSLVKAPEVYQFHCNVRKVNRKGKTQDRVLIVSNQWIYNLDSVDEEEETINSFKWSLPIASLLRVAVEDDEKSRFYSATIHFDLSVSKSILKQSAYSDRKTGTKGSSINDKHQLLFVSKDTRNRCAMALLALYFSQTKKKLGYSKGSANTKAVRSSQLGVVKKEGMMMKYTRGTFGTIGKHQRFFQIKSTGIIGWGKTKQQTSYFEQLVAVRQRDAALSKFKLTEEELSRFLCIQTTGKTIYLIGETIDEANDWVKCIQSVLQDMQK